MESFRFLTNTKPPSRQSSISSKFQNLFEKSALLDTRRYCGNKGVSTFKGKCFGFKQKGEDDSNFDTSGGPGNISQRGKIRELHAFRPFISPKVMCCSENHSVALSLSPTFLNNKTGLVVSRPYKFKAICIRNYNLGRRILGILFSSLWTSFHKHF